MPPNAIWLITEISHGFIILSRTEVIAKHVTGVVQDDVEDNVETACVRFVNETAKLHVGKLGILTGGGSIERKSWMPSPW